MSFLAGRYAPFGLTFTYTAGDRKMVKTIKCVHEVQFNWIWFYPLDGSASFKIHQNDEDMSSYLASSTERNIDGDHSKIQDIWKGRVRYLNSICEQQQLQIDQLIEEVKKLKAH